MNTHYYERKVEHRRANANNLADYGLCTKARKEQLKNIVTSQRTARQRPGPLELCDQ